MRRLVACFKLVSLFLPMRSSSIVLTVSLKKTFSSPNKKKYLSDIQKVSSTAPVKVEAHSAEWLSDDVFSCVPINYLFRVYCTRRSVTFFMLPSIHPLQKAHTLICSFARYPPPATTCVIVVGGGWLVERGLSSRPKAWLMARTTAVFQRYELHNVITMTSLGWKKCSPHA